MPAALTWSKLLPPGRARRRRKTEADTLLVPVLGAAASKGIATPINDRMLAIIRELENGARSQSWKNFEGLEAVMD